MIKKNWNMLGILIFWGDSSEQTKDNMKLLGFFKNHIMLTVKSAKCIVRKFLVESKLFFKNTWAWKLAQFYLGNKASIIFSNH